MNDEYTPKLPEEWNTPIPPQPINIIEQRLGDINGTRPVWNKQWLQGLESFVRRIVREELKGKNP